MPTPAIRASGSLGFGRVLRQAPDKFEEPSLSRGLSSSSTASLESCALQLSPGRASLLYLNVLTELSEGMAIVHVSSSCCSYVAGRLDWRNSPLEDVEFTLLEIKPGYVVVGEVCVGPELFNKVCWRLKSVNGIDEVSPGSIVKGDRLLLESPNWAMERLAKSQPLPTGSPLASASSSTSTADAQLAVPAPVVGGEGASAPSVPGFDVVPAGRIARQAPIVPRLDLTRITDRPVAKAPPSWLDQITALLGVNLSVRPQPGHGQCTDFWHCT